MPKMGKLEINLKKSVNIDKLILNIMYMLDCIKLTKPEKSLTKSSKVKRNNLMPSLE